MSKRLLPPRAYELREYMPTGDASDALDFVNLMASEGLEYVEGLESAVRGRVEQVLFRRTLGGPVAVVLSERDSNVRALRPLPAELPDESSAASSRARMKEAALALLFRRSECSHADNDLVEGLRYSPWCGACGACGAIKCDDGTWRLPLLAELAVALRLDLRDST
jgi:hypothetical protein